MDAACKDCDCVRSAPIRNRRLRLGLAPPYLGIRWGIHYIGAPQRIAFMPGQNGTAVAITGQRYRYYGHKYLELRYRFAEPWRVGIGETNGGWVGQGSQITEGMEVVAACQVRPFAVVYGSLNRSGYSVLAQTATGTVRLHDTALPGDLHTHGVLAYGRLTSQPTRFLVREPDGDVTRLSEFESDGTAGGQPCGGQEREWVGLRFTKGTAGAALATITKCLRDEGFEVGPQPGFGEGSDDARWHRFEAAQRSCRRLALKASGAWLRYPT